MDVKTVVQRQIMSEPDNLLKNHSVVWQDAGYGSVRRDRGWLVGVCPPFRWIRDPNETYQQLSQFLSQKQIPQSEIWFADDSILQKELETSATRFRVFSEGKNLLPACIHAVGMYTYIFLK